MFSLQQDKQQNPIFKKIFPKFDLNLKSCCNPPAIHSMVMCLKFKRCEFTSFPYQQIAIFSRKISQKFVLLRQPHCQISQAGYNPKGSSKNYVDKISLFFAIYLPFVDIRGYFAYYLPFVRVDSDK